MIGVVSRTTGQRASDDGKLFQPVSAGLMLIQLSLRLISCVYLPGCQSKGGCVRQSRSGT